MTPGIFFWLFPPFFVFFLYFLFFLTPLFPPRWLFVIVVYLRAVYRIAAPREVTHIDTQIETYRRKHDAAVELVCCRIFLHTTYAPRKKKKKNFSRLSRLPSPGVFVHLSIRIIKTFYTGITCIPTNSSIV